MQKEMVLFGPQVITVVLEHQRVFGRALRTWYDLTVSEYCLIRAVEGADEPLFTTTLTDFLMLKRGTVFDVLASLETKGLVKKDVDSDDHRVMRASLTEKGRRVALEATSRLYALIRHTFGRDLPEQEGLGISQFIRSGVDALRGKSIPEIRTTPGSVALPVDYPLYWSALIDRWKAVVKDVSRLTFGEYRILALLEDSGALNITDISDRLLIEQSNVSLYKRRLIARGLLLEVKGALDGRAVILRCTKMGAKVAGDLNDALSKVTRLAHEHLPDVGIMTVNAWYVRMYLNLDSIRYPEEELRQLYESGPHPHRTTSSTCGNAR